MHKHSIKHSWNNIHSILQKQSSAICYFRWVLACAKSGKRENVEQFLIENMKDDNQMVCSADNKVTSTTGDKAIQEADHANKTTEVITAQSATKNMELSENQISEKDINEKKDVSNGGEESCGKSVRCNVPEFSVTGDTEALLMQLDSQADNIKSGDRENIQQTSHAVKHADKHNRTGDRIEQDVLSHHKVNTPSAVERSKQPEADVPSQCTKTPALSRCRYNTLTLDDVVVCFDNAVLEKFLYSYPLL